MSNQDFYQWLKPKLDKKPSATLDQRILLMASQKMQVQTASHRSRWTISLGFVLATAIIIFSVNSKFNQQKDLNKLVLNETPDMILNYENIELMADSAKLSDADWDRIEGLRK